jgi:polyribonucleotide nucleotidyltransferase
MEDEMNKAVDQAHNSVQSCINLLKEVFKQIERCKGMNEATEKSDCEFKYSRMVGQCQGSLDSIKIAAEIMEEKLEDAFSATTYLRGNHD